MHCFQKCRRIPPKMAVSSGLRDVSVSFSKTVQEDGENKTYVTFEKISNKLYAQRSDIPDSDSYKLREMLKQGYLPNEVSLSGIFDSKDSLDSANLEFVGKFTESISASSDNVEIVDSKSE